MRLSASPRTAIQHHWRVIWLVGVDISLLCGAWLVTVATTDYRLVNRTVEFSLPLVTLVASLVALRAGRHARSHRRLARLACGPGLLVGGGSTLLALVLLPFGLLINVWLGDDRPYVTHFQRITAPGGTRVATVDYYAPMLSTASRGTVSVTVTYYIAGIPLVYRDAYDPSVPEFDPFDRPRTYSTFVRWRGDDALYVPATRTTIALGLLRVSLSRSP